MPRTAEQQREARRTAKQNRERWIGYVRQLLERASTVEARLMLADLLIATPHLFGWPAHIHKTAVGIATEVKKKIYGSKLEG